MPHATSIGHGMDGRPWPHGTDELIARLAERQHGRVARWQLLQLGIGAGAIDWRVAQGRLWVVHAGVYAVGHRVASPRARWMAAVLACGRKALLSYRSAAALWDTRPSSRTTPDVTVPGWRRRPGIAIHSADIADDERTTHHNIPVTTVARTLLDLASVVQPSGLERAVERAEALGLADHTSLPVLLDRYPRRRGTRVLRQILATGITPVRTRSELERDFVSLLEIHGLPRPVVNGTVEGYEVDFHWPGPRVVVEVDGREAHLTGAAFERDRARDRRLQARGWRVVRITWRQVREDAEGVARDLSLLLQAHAPPGHR